MNERPIEATLRLRVGSEDAHYGTIAAGAFVMRLRPAVIEATPVADVLSSLAQESLA